MRRADDSHVTRWLRLRRGLRWESPRPSGPSSAVRPDSSRSPYRRFPSCCSLLPQTVANCRKVSQTIGRKLSPLDLILTHQTPHGEVGARAVVGAEPCAPALEWNTHARRSNVRRHPRDVESSSSEQGRRP